MKIRMVLIEWNDSNVTHGWRPDDCKDDTVAHCWTIGVVRVEDDEKITVAFGGSDCGSVMETITIPIGCITKIKELRLK